MNEAKAKDEAAGWEFKILRTAAAWFGDPQRFKAILHEEARAGWVLLEKFDDNRVRLKRLASARQQDSSLGFDPYRSFVGPNQALAVARVVGFAVLLAAVLIGAAFAAVWLLGGH
ncbi:MAG: hypothetical protein WAN43_18755 [Rhodomicrobium sp.]|jgi:hypothetical protein